MIDPFARTLLASSLAPIDRDETSPFLGLNYLKKIAKIYFDTPDEIDLDNIEEALAKLSLASSLLMDQTRSEENIATAFLIAEAAEIAIDDAIEKIKNITETFGVVTHLLDIASFFHMADYDANANVMASKAVNALNRQAFENQDQISLAQINYYKGLGYFLGGGFGALLNESQKKVEATSTQDQVFVRLLEILAEITNYYRGLGGVSAKSLSDLAALGEITSAFGLYTVLNTEIVRLQNFASVVSRKALYPLLVEKLSSQKNYLDARVSGISERSFPFAWPPVRKFCDNYLGGKEHHAVITLPTGSGKSFLAELAIVDAIKEGWILYLAPTNALCAQIKNDLSNNLITVQNSEVDLFLGGIEYMPDMADLKSTQSYLAVMTPEKASLLLKLYPDKAKNCALIILDECHVLGEASRGVISEFVLSSMLSASPNLHVIFMSALVGNPDHLANWLTIKTGKTVAVLQDDWRPTRSSRIVLTQNWGGRKGSREGEKIKYYLPITAVSDAYTPWIRDNNHYFSWSTNLVLESNQPNNFNPEKNILAKNLAESFALKNLQTLIIVFNSKHSVFGTAEKITGMSPSTIPQSQSEFDWLEIANYELGIPSIVATLISNNQASVHSAIMLQAERKASEDAYNRERTKIMVSTTTLAQGLNLNSQAVILAGTEFYIDPDEEETVDLETRTLQQVLNGCGRAARANVTNRGFSVIIPGPRILFPQTNVKTSIIDALPVISKKENIFAIYSKIQELLVQVQIDDQDSLPNSAELQLALLLPTNNKDAERFLNSTFASLEIASNQLENVLKRLDIVKRFWTEGETPEWLLQVAHLSNTDVKFIVELRGYILALGEEHSFESYSDLAFLLVDWLEKLDPHLTWEFLLEHVKRWRWYWGKENEKDPPFADQVKANESILDNSQDQLAALWQNLKDCLFLWLDDGTYLDIGINLVRGKCKPTMYDKRSSSGHPIPRAIVWSQKTMDRLSVFAGALSALRDLWKENDKESLPKWLSESKLVQTLPMAIRFGVNNPTSLIWYRSIIGERRTANLLSQLIPFTIENPLDEKDIRQFLGSARKYLFENEELVQNNDLVAIIRRLAK
jgi:superfamily II DNA/RNA helicase